MNEKTKRLIEQKIKNKKSIKDPIELKLTLILELLQEIHDLLEERL